MTTSSSRLSHKIDVHHHFVPPAFRAALLDAPGPLVRHLPEWSAELSDDILSTLGSRVAILSITTPGPEIVQGEAQARLCREINEWAAKLRDARSSQFGFFATIPSLLDANAALVEICYALDTLKADGVALFTSYGDGQFYLGHPRFEPLWHELDSRKAVVFTHPVGGAQKVIPNPRMPPPFVDFPSETARAALDMILRGVKRRYSKCKVILSHGGGTLPFLIHRASYMWPPTYSGQPTREHIEEDFKSFYFDLALAGTKNILDVLLDLVPHDRIVFGSDFPYAPTPAIELMTESLEEYEMDPELRKKIYFKNALKLFPRFEQGL